MEAPACPRSAPGLPQVCPRSAPGLSSITQRLLCQGQGHGYWWATSRDIWYKHMAFPRKGILPVSCWTTVAKYDLLGHCFEQSMPAACILYLYRIIFAWSSVQCSAEQWIGGGWCFGSVMPQECSAQNSWEKWLSKLDLATVIQQFFLTLHKMGTIFVLRKPTYIRTQAFSPTLPQVCLPSYRNCSRTDGKCYWLATITWILWHSCRKCLNVPWAGK